MSDSVNRMVNATPAVEVEGAESLTPMARVFMVPKFDKDRPPSKLTSLPDGIEKQLFDWRTGSELAPQADTDLSNFLKDHHRKWWLGCPCRGKHDAVAKYPFFCIVKTDGVSSGNKASDFNLRSLTSRVGHHEDCLLAAAYRAQSSADVVIDPEFGGVRQASTSEDALARMLRGDALVDQLAPSKVGEPSHGRLPGWGKADAGEWSLMMEPIVRARLNVLRDPTSRRNERNEYAAAASGIGRLDPEISLSQLLMVDKYRPPGRAVDALLHVVNWPRDEARISYVLVVAREILFTPEGTTIYFDVPPGADESVPRSLELPWRLRVNASSHELKARAPYLVLLKVVVKQDGAVEWDNGCAHSILREWNWMPVDSEKERQGAFELLRIARCPELQRMGVTLEVQKIVRNVRTPCGPCRPDFKLKATFANRRVFEAWLEINGSGLESYVVRKRSTHAAMRSDAPVIECQWHSMADGAAEANMRREVLTWLRDPEDYARRQGAASGAR